MSLLLLFSGAGTAPVITEIGWLTEYTPPRRAKQRSVSDIAFVPPVDTFSFGWYVSFNATPKRKVVRPVYETFTPFNLETTNLGWFAEYPKARPRKVRPQQELVNILGAELNAINFGWFVSYARPVQFSKKAFSFNLRNDTPFFGYFVPPVVIPPVPGTIQDLYRSGAGKKRFWEQVYAAGIRRGPNNVAGRIRR